ncbi:hypothetical protein K5X82_09975 [Halosquirtibacter xylanolyticus]|uniref:hypothetical protein n=1 Tax=Halosquirtibacter xylanolyticus TaxID=3374599 RepID=UPI0037490E9C|nr:hypothetical protein K5X82_09975 [Prolixibacteraceae bacterium]
MGRIEIREETTLRIIEGLTKNICVLDEKHDSHQINFQQWERNRAFLHGIALVTMQQYIHQTAKDYLQARNTRENLLTTFAYSEAIPTHENISYPQLIHALATFYTHQEDTYGRGHLKTLNGGTINTLIQSNLLNTEIFSNDIDGFPKENLFNRDTTILDGVLMMDNRGNLSTIFKQLIEWKEELQKHIQQ